jgi:serine-type D-Ala-D-Ala carboxypeptidase (penicillin-binding protein 5/6)
MRTGPRHPAGRSAKATLLVALLVGLLTVGAAPGAALAADPGTRSGDVRVGGDALDTSGVVVSPGATPLPEGLTGASFVVADLDSGDVLAARDPHGRYGPASTIKTLTLLALEPHLDAGAVHVATREDVDLPLDSSRVGLVAGIEYPISELLESLMMVSGNDSANALTTAVGGLPRALDLMAAEARRLQAHNTIARTPHGLDDPGQVSSAYDLALIARAGLADPDFARYVSTVRSSIAAPDGERFETYTKNRLLTRYDGALGVKNGYTVAQRASFVGAAERNGRRLVVTVMRADPRVWEETAALLDWGFGQRAGLRPVGELVEPLDAAGTVAGQPGSAESGLAPAAAVPDSGGSAWPGLLGGTVLVLIGSVAGLRVRAVRLQQRRRRTRARQRARAAALRRAAQRPAPRHAPARRVDARPPSAARRSGAAAATPDAQRRTRSRTAEPA